MAIIRVCQTTKTFDHHMMVEVAGQQDGYFAQKILLMRPAFAHCTFGYVSLEAEHFNDALFGIETKFFLFHNRALQANELGRN